MAITKTDFSTFIKSFRFRELFNEMGWNNVKMELSIPIDSMNYKLDAVAEKSAFKIFTCIQESEIKIPDYATRKKIESKLTKLFQEHMIIFTDGNKIEQIWQLAIRKIESPKKIVETRYYITQDPELLYQRASGLFFTLDEEEKVTIIDVTKRVADNFQQNNEEVTKKFYDGFKKEYVAFLKFIKGIDDNLSKEWYASLMLNRLMFCYFIQKKGFLDNNNNYLQDKLTACKEKNNNNTDFHSFYRNFLLNFFHQGLGMPDHGTDMQNEFGLIPYLNGSLFSEHEVESKFPDIEINDEAFENIFNFFDQYEWHLDTRETASGRDINPDVIGYIFEKYINDRAKMGAYYTREDITDYISRNCIIPWLFDELKLNYPNDEWIWQFVKDSDDDYIFETLKHGRIKTDDSWEVLPENVEKVCSSELEQKIVDENRPFLWELRKDWKSVASIAFPNIALEMETFREIIERRKRYEEIRNVINEGKIKNINDFITSNLNIRQFAQDIIEIADDPEFIHQFFNTISRIKILDPTCGSGAFLFSALNILEPLYEACILRMKTFIAESSEDENPSLSFFNEVLARVNAPEHPNLQYFIYKSIILNNLHGVDIMKEAVEIAKLRLFLKLVAAVDPDYHKLNLGLEPLPDIDFNIRAGNMLIGYASEKQIKDALRSTLDILNTRKNCEEIGKRLKQYNSDQLAGKTTFNSIKEEKGSLNDLLTSLREELNAPLFPKKIKKDVWLATYRPFHWFTEFYDIIDGRGGFDVIIGNPPYVNTKKIKYEIPKMYKTILCGDLFGICMERAFQLLNNKARFGMIVPLSATSTPKMDELKKLIINKDISWNSYYSASDQPSSLFSGVRHRLMICIKAKTDHVENHSTDFIKWLSSERKYLFDTKIIYYSNKDNNDTVPPNFKISRPLEFSILKKLFTNSAFESSKSETGVKIYYHNAPVHWGKVFNFIPYNKEDEVEKRSSHLKDLTLDTKKKANALIAYLNSTLFYWFNFQFTNCRDLTVGNINQIRFDSENLRKDLQNNLDKLVVDLMKDLKKNSIIYSRTLNGKHTEFEALFDLINLFLPRRQNSHVFGYLPRNMQIRRSRAWHLSSSRSIPTEPVCRSAPSSRINDMMPRHSRRSLDEGTACDSIPNLPRS